MTAIEVVLCVALGVIVGELIIIHGTLREIIRELKQPKGATDENTPDSNWLRNAIK